jgi:NDP-sugar pyrophosphorylase family protein
MLEVAGRPFVDHKVEQLVGYGIGDIVLLVGHGAAQLIDHVGDGSRYGTGVRVRCVEDGPELLGTGGAVRAALEHDGMPDRFWLTYGDTLLAAPMPEIEAWFLGSEHRGLMTVLHNRDQWEPSNVRVEGEVVAEYEKGRPPGTFEHIDYGLLILGRDAFVGFPAGSAFDLAAVLQRLIQERTLAAYVVEGRFHDIGTPDAYAETDVLLRKRGV